MSDVPSVLEKTEGGFAKESICSESELFPPSRFWTIARWSIFLHLFASATAFCIYVVIASSTLVAAVTVVELSVLVINASLLLLFDLEATLTRYLATRLAQMPEMEDVIQKNNAMAFIRKRRLQRTSQSVACGVMTLAAICFGCFMGFIMAFIFFSVPPPW